MRTCSQKSSVSCFFNICIISAIGPVFCIECVLFCSGCNDCKRPLVVEKNCMYLCMYEYLYNVLLRKIVCICIMFEYLQCAFDAFEKSIRMCVCACVCVCVCMNTCIYVYIHEYIYIYIYICIYTYINRHSRRLSKARCCRCASRQV